MTTEQLRELREKLKKCWCIETIWHKPDWNPDKLSKGQCYVTALLIQDILGGRIFHGTVESENHYWNELPDGTEVDLTSDQFDDGDGIHVHPKHFFLGVTTPNKRNKRYLTLKEKYLAVNK